MNLNYFQREEERHFKGMYVEEAYCVARRNRNDCEKVRLKNLCLKSIYLKKFYLNNKQYDDCHAKYFQIDSNRLRLYADCSSASNRHLFVLFNFYLWLILIFSFKKLFTSLVKLFSPIGVSILILFSLLLLIFLGKLNFYRKYFCNYRKFLYRQKCGHYALRLRQKQKRKRYSGYFSSLNGKEKNFGFTKLFLFVNYDYFQKFFNNLNFFLFVLFIKNYLLLNCFTFFNLIVIKLKQLKRNTNVSVKLKSFCFIFFLFPSMTRCNSSTSSISSVPTANFFDDKNASNSMLSSIKNNTIDINNNNNNTSNTMFVYVEEDVTWPIKYDENLFRELNMHETVQNVYRSCFKENFEENFSNSNQKKSGKHLCLPINRRVIPTFRPRT